MSERPQAILPWASSTTPYAFASRRANQGSRGKVFFVVRDRVALGELLTGDAADQPGVAVELVVQPLEQIARHHPSGRQRLERIRPSTLAAMWQMTCGFMGPPSSRQCNAVPISGFAPKLGLLAPVIRDRVIANCRVLRNIDLS